MLSEKMVLQDGRGRVYRLLKIDETGGMLVPCDKCALPVYQPIEVLRGYNKASLALDNALILEEDIPLWKKEERNRRWELIREITGEQYLADAVARRRKIKEAALRGGCDVKTIQRYLWRYWVYQTHNALIPEDRSRAVRQDEKGADVSKGYDKVFRWALNKYYYTSQNQTLEMAYRMMLKDRFCNAEGQLLPEYPSYWQFRYYFRQHRSRITETISRKGLTAYQRNHRPITGSVQTYAKNIGVFMADATEADIYIVSRLTRKPVGRPIVYTMVDAYSQLIAGVYVGLEGGAQAVRLLLINTCTDKAVFCRQHGLEITADMWPSAHLPQKIITDRGSEFTSGIMSNLCGFCDIEVDTLPAYRPDLKGPVEKLFDILQNRYKPLLKGKGVIEPDAQERGAQDYRRQSVLDIEQFTQILLRCVIHYNTQTLLTSFVRTPQMIEENVPATPAAIWRHCEPSYSGSNFAGNLEALKRALLPRTNGRITQRGLVVFGLSYTNPDFKENFVTAGITGTTVVRVSYDPNNLDVVWLVERGKMTSFALTATQYRGRTLQEVIDLKQNEKAMREEWAIKGLQADIDLMSEIQDIVRAASPQTDMTASAKMGERIKEERKVEKHRLRKQEASAQSDAQDLLTMLKEHQKGGLDL